MNHRRCCNFVVKAKSFRMTKKYLAKLQSMLRTPKSPLVDAKSVAASSATGICEEAVVGKREYSFDIFDGTNAGGAFASFVFDGDDSEDEAEERSTEFWSGCQDITVSG